MRNNRRYDLSDRLIHFFRKLDFSDDSVPHLPEFWGWGNIDDSEEFSAIFLLRSAIRYGRLWATWSLRNGVRTIYGLRPAICFTDMPIAAFLEASVARKQAGQKISTFALSFPKSQMFALGARPVIYALSDSNIAIPQDGNPRLIPADALPLIEQYRYVTYNPTGSYQVDWTHEREWRWPYSGSLTKFETEIATYGIVSDVKDIPGLHLYTGDLSNLGVIVNTKEEAYMVIHDILSLVDRRIIAARTFEYVLVSNDIIFPANIRDPDEAEQAITAATINLSRYLTPEPKTDETLTNRVNTIAREIEANAGEPEVGELGGCWLWLLDNFHPLTRALINTDSVVVNRDGKYLMFPNEFSGSRSLRQREQMTQELAHRIGEEFGIATGYFSVLMSNDPNKVPFYNSDHLDNHLHYNWSSYGLD